MKEYEKLAIDYTINIPNELSGVEGDWISDAYCEGYLKAKEMIEVALMLQEKPRVEDIHIIRDVGEKEV